jgi:purine-binding chemotaxis protein CheW
VLALSGEQVRPAPEFSAAFDTSFITGLATIEDRMLILVDIEKLMTGAEMALLDTSRH